MTEYATAAAKQRRLFGMLAIGGGFVLACGLGFDPTRIWGNLLLVTFFLLTIGLGGAVFVALAYVTGAGWNVAFRRIPEAMAQILPIAGLAMLLVLGVRMNHYGWHHHGEGGAGTFWFKELWLTPTFWAIRAVVYVALWVLLSSRLVSRSRKQDESGDAAITTGNVRLSALFLAVYAITFSLASIDWIMALEPLWFSTMWGVYNFSGMIQAALAVVVILGLLLRQPNRPLHGVFNDDHLHDLGKLLLGFSCFWMYIWFSQYMLIWYSNIPEETSYFIARARGPWAPVVVLAIILNWIIPFFVLLPKPAKRSGSVMMKVAVVVLIGRWVDLYLMVIPSLSHATEHGEERLYESPIFSIWEAAGIFCLIGAASFLLLRSFAAMNPVPRKDPFLAESLHYHAG
jgi:hypothetical protein